MKFFAAILFKINHRYHLAASRLPPPSRVGLGVMTEALDSDCLNTVFPPQGQMMSEA
ncbi:hypothetical protein HanIR_Chr14g0715621 [Helianthus annuus]|nr:hypothetical protein HanIR_Chr14g0715621 [Helianthus annuus]